MRSPIPYKRSVFVFLFLHTAIIVLLALMAVHEDTPRLAIILGIAGAVALTVYTAYNIIHKSLARHAQELQERMKALDDYAIELRLWAGEMSDQKRELQQRADTINEYSDRIKYMIRMIEASKETADETKIRK